MLGLKANKPFRLAVLRSNEQGQMDKIVLVNEGDLVEGIVSELYLGYLTWHDLGFGNIGFYKTQKNAEGVFEPVEECVAYNTRTRFTLVKREFINRLIEDTKLINLDYSDLRAQLANLANEVSVAYEEGN